MGCSESADKRNEDERQSDSGSPTGRVSRARSAPPSTAAGQTARSRRPSRSAISVCDTKRSYGEPSPMPPVPQWLLPAASEDSSASSSTSAPQLFRISPTYRAQGGGTGTWPWWIEQVRKEKITKDCISREHLQDLPNRLQCQYHADPKNVEIDLSQCYMEHTAPYIIGNLLASTKLQELNWVTSLRLDGNYFTDSGFGSLLASMATTNEKRSAVLPNLRQLFMNNMNLDRNLVSAIFAVLFPINAAAGSPAEESRIGHNVATRSSLEQEILRCKPSKVALFPSLEILSLSDNQGLGVPGLVQILRSLIATHYESRSLAVLDLSRCGIDEPGLRFVQEFLDAVPRALREGCRPVIPKRLLLIGNPLQMEGSSRGQSASFGLRDPDIRVEF